MIKISDIDHVIYRHPDLERLETFLLDFGMVRAERTPDRLYMRGTGPAPYIYVAEQATEPAFVAAAFRVASAADLETASRLLGASPVEPIDGPGGGRRVRLAAPENFRLDLVYGIAPAEPLPVREPLTINHAGIKRRHGEVQRPPRGPAQISRLGHVLLTANDWDGMVAWLRETLGLIASDVLFDGTQDNGVGAFLRGDRGDAWVDHHTVALFRSRRTGIHHASFEVQDYDAQYIGHEWLQAGGWKSFWGVGRHVLGSQIFDYWEDPAGFVLEHFTDGDLYRADLPTRHYQATPDMLYQWGPPVPPTFIP